MNREFEAFTECPSCGVLAVHWLRVAKDVVDDREVKEMYMIRSFGGACIEAEVGSALFEPSAEVVRSCRSCSRSWLEGNREKELV